jgi:hypothetical protein
VRDEKSSTQYTGYAGAYVYGQRGHDLRGPSVGSAPVFRLTVPVDNFLGLSTAGAYWPEVQGGGSLRSRRAREL